MKYSFCFCYRDREEHMNIVFPRIHEYISKRNLDFEFIVVEQNDAKKFRRGNLLNEAVKVASGDIVVLHDIDFYPVEGEYWDGVSEVYRPVTKVRFVKNDLTDQPLEEIPTGFFNLDPVQVTTTTDDKYYGGVTTFVRDAFYKINGFNPWFVGWGHEDDDLGRRIGGTISVSNMVVTLSNNLNSNKSSNGLFYILEHKDSKPLSNDLDYLNNERIPHRYGDYLHMGIKNQISKTKIVTPKHSLVDKWIMATNFDKAPILERTLHNGRWI